METDPRLDEWLARVLATPGLTALSDAAEARRVLLEDSLRAVDILRRYGGPVVDVGSGGGAPGIPLAAALPDREIVLLEGSRRKCAFLEEVAVSFQNVSVVCGRAEEQATDVFGVAVAKALAPPPVAAEWCLPLVRPGGAAVLFVGPSATPEAVGVVAAKLGSRLAPSPDGFLVLEKLTPTPAGFPRRAGVARKRPLA